MLASFVIAAKVEAKASSENLSSVVWIKTIGEQHGQQLFISKKEILFPQETEIPTWCHMPIKYILWVRQDLNLKMIARFKSHIDFERKYFVAR